MRFGPVSLDQAEGAILAHSERADRKIAKGTVLNADHVARLAAAGFAQVTVARLEPGDLHEDAAAERLARAICGPGLTQTMAKTGRVNLLAEGPGVVCIDVDKVNALNAVDPMLTLATVPRFQRMGPGGMAATVKVISYGVAEASVARACAVAKGALSLAAPVIETATLIETRVGDDMPADKGRRAMRKRLEILGAVLTERVVVPHDEAAIAAALTAAPGDLLLILTASATSDLHDTAPEGLRQAGGAVIHYGMPVDPGNLLFLGRLGQKPVIGLPGCARSPALNGVDWVLERVACGIDVTGADIAAMGVGGLLKEIRQRGRLREAE